MANNITPCIWFENQAEQATQLYTSLFADSQTGRVEHYGPASAKASGMPEGSVMTIEFELAGQPFLALNGGNAFTPNPSISFILNFDPSKDDDARKTLDRTWEKLSAGGEVLMPLQEYPFSKRYGWVQDRYGVSWQLILADPAGDDRPFIVPSLLFTNEQCGKAEQAIDTYTSVFENSEKGHVARYPASEGPDEEGTIMYADFKIEGQWFAAMDSAQDHEFGFTEGISLIIECEDQKEIDHYWDALTDGGEESVCGWLKDKYGVSWQVVPAALAELLADEQKHERVMQALLQMKKLDIGQLTAAAD